MNRRRMILAAASAALLAGPALAEPPKMIVAKSPTCGCCGAWVEHMQAAGFEVDVRNMEQDSLDAIKAKLGVRSEHASCNTATIGGYVVEGHVPADDIKRLLDEKPKALGLAVPGMPTGSPGMEYGDEKDPYDTMLISADGSATVFAEHR